MSETNSKARVAVALALILAAGGYSYHKWAQLHPKGINNMAGMGPGGPKPPGAPGEGRPPQGTPPSGQSGTPPQGIPPPERGPPGGGPPGPQQMMADLGLTAEQQKQIDEIRKTSGNNFQAMREATDKVLTADQRQKMQEQMRKRMEEGRSRMDARLKRTLSDEDFAAFKRRMEQMGPPPGGGPPPPPPGM